MKIDLSGVDASVTVVLTRQAMEELTSAYGRFAVGEQVVNFQGISGIEIDAGALAIYFHGGDTRIFAPGTWVRFTHEVHYENPDDLPF